MGGASIVGTGEEDNGRFVWWITITFENNEAGDDDDGKKRRRIKRL